jgi:hypothetical protein
MKKTKRQIRQDRTWKHFLFWLGNGPHFINMQQSSDYNPEQWRAAFERYQSQGKSALSNDELAGIQPLIDGQRQKEICLNGHVAESMEWWAWHQGWIHPLRDSLIRGGYDRLTKVAILRMIRSMRDDLVGFFARHPGLDESVKSRHFAQYSL